MKRIFLLLFSFLCIRAMSQNISDKYLFDYIKVWGFLKYYHPAVAGGKADADVLFMAWIGKVRAAKTDRDYAAILNDISAGLGKIPMSSSKDTTKLLLKNDKTAWISNDKLLPLSFKTQLLQLRKQGFTDSVHRYLPQQFFDTRIPAEKAYDSVSFPNTDMQLFALARYWNAIEYLFGYKYMISQNWDNVLKRQLPFFAKPMNAAEYELHILQLNAAIEDTHGGIVSLKRSAQTYGLFFPPFVFQFAGDTIVVTDYIDSIACAKHDIRKGDLITGIRNLTVAKAVEACGYLVSASNESTKRSLLSSIPLLKPFRGNDSIVPVRILRDGKLLQRQVPMQKTVNPSFANNINNLYRRQAGDGSTSKNDFILRSLTADIAQVDAARLSILYNSSDDDHAIDSVLQLMKTHKKAILLDLRCYSTQAVFYNKLLPALGKPLKPFARLQAHYKRYPGTYYEEDIFSVVPKQPLQPVYPGKIILLVNEATQSQSELITMIMQASASAKVVGTQTGGCDGDAIRMPVPGGYTLIFSGAHVDYRDGTPSQKVGVKRDVKVKRTTKGIVEERDEVLEAAMRVGE
ncbi:MAG: hypothetical protein DI535_18730 [Citrobacter freundii]|nr:MAG: hypothetical protein DI535_18730 [Citrobacter freundii]